MVTMSGEDSSGGVAASTAPTADIKVALRQQDDDDVNDAMSDSSSQHYDDDQGLMSGTMDDEVTAQLAAAGPVGMAAAAAIASAKKRKRPHQFETNPSIRKRQQTRLLRKLRQTIDEFTIRVGMQAVVMVAVPGKPQNSFKCFGAKPLEDVVRNLRPVIMQDLEGALAQHAPIPAPEDPTLHELPPLVIDGIPTPVEKMTQAQLRAFIPLMLKYSTGRGKPGWGKDSTKPPWWPEGLPWANVRMDARTEDEKQKVSWTHALRQIVINCYKYHGREDLLPVFSGEAEVTDVKPALIKMPKASPQHVSTNTTTTTNTSAVVSTSQSQNQSIPQAMPVSQFAPTVLQTISNPDGTVSIIQVDPANSIITLPDGSTAQVQGVATLQQSSDGTHTVQSVQSMEVATSGGGGHQEGASEMPVAVDLNSVAQAAIGQEGQIILTGEDGQAYPVTVSGMITVPVPHNMYQTVVANISSLHGGDGTLQKSQTRTIRLARPSQTPAIASQVVHPMVVPKVEPGTENEATATIPVSALTGDPTQTQVVTVNANGQVVHSREKLCQIYDLLKSDAQGKLVMMTEVAPTTTSNSSTMDHVVVANSHSHHISQSNNAGSINHEDKEIIIKSGSPVDSTAS